MYASALIKKQRYWSKLVTGELIDTHFEDKDIGDIGMLETITQDNKLFKIFCIKEPYSVMKIMAIWMLDDT